MKELTQISRTRRLPPQGHSEELILVSQKVQMLQQEHIQYTEDILLQLEKQQEQQQRLDYMQQRQEQIIIMLQYLKVVMSELAILHLMLPLMWWETYIFLTVFHCLRPQYQTERLRRPNFVRVMERPIA